MANKAETKKQESSLSRFIRDTRGEIRKVVWPTREEAYRLTVIVLAVTAAFAFFLWAVDSIFSNGLRFLIEAIAGI